EEHGERVRHWFQEKKAGWDAVLADPQMPARSTVLEQTHNAIDRQLFAMQGQPFQHVPLLSYLVISFGRSHATHMEVTTMLLATIFAPFVQERPICVM